MKKQYVIDFLYEKLGVKLSIEQLDALVEAAVYETNSENWIVKRVK